MSRSRDPRTAHRRGPSSLQMSIRRSTWLVTKSARRGRMRARSLRIWWNLKDDGWSHWLLKSATVSSVELCSMASPRTWSASPQSSLPFRSRWRSIRFLPRASAMALAPSTLHFSPMRLPERLSTVSWQSSLRSVPRCRAPSAPSSLHRRSRTLRVLFSMRKETSCLTPSSRIRCLPSRSSLRCVFTRSMRPRCTVCSSCRLLRRGFSMSQSLSLAAPSNIAAARATKTLMSSSASARKSSWRLVFARRSSTTARPPPRPTGFCERSSRRSVGQDVTARQSASQPSAPMELPRSVRLLKPGARPRSVARLLAPASPRRFCVRSTSSRKGAESCRTSQRTARSSSRMRQLKVRSSQPGALMPNFSEPLVRSALNARGLAVRPSAAAAAW
mmetsp:Transcript_43420/g.138176  ORF Transcript_43420/g.138176 Transcript_43420/m.138176 type:complete len:388 (+) Transcript_43420:86-1249(+)